MLFVKHLENAMVYELLYNFQQENKWKHFTECWTIPLVGPSGCLHPLHCSLNLISVTNSFSTARWILQLTLTKHVYSVTNVHFRYAKRVILWKLNYEPKLILTWFAHRSYNPVFLFHSIKKIWERLSCSPWKRPLENFFSLIWKLKSSVYTGGHVMSGYLEEKWHQYGNN